MLNRGPNPNRQLVASYRRLRQLDDSLPIEFPRTDALREYVNAINEVKNAQLKELFTLRENHDAVVTRHITLLHSVKYASEVDSLIALDQAIDAINNEIICTKIDLNQTSLDISDCGITRLPASLFMMPGFYPFFINLEEINCSKNHIKVLSLRNLPSLQIIDCDESAVERLKLENLPELFDVSITNSSLKGRVDFRAFPKLFAIYLHNNHLEAIDVRGLNSLEVLDCSNNNLIELNVDSPVIRELNCSWNHILRLNIAHVDYLKLPKKVKEEDELESGSEQEDIGTFLSRLPVLNSHGSDEVSDEASSDIGGLHLYVNALNEIPRNLVDKFGEEWAAEEMAEQLQLGIPQRLLRDEEVPAALIPAAAKVPAAAAPVVIPQFQMQTRSRTRMHEQADCGAQEEQQAKKHRHK